MCLLSDTHGVLDPRVAEIARGCEIAVHAGDIGCASILDELREACHAVVAVRGNNDVASKWPKGERAQLDAIEKSAELELPGGLLIVEHGDRRLPADRRHDLLRRAHPGAKLIVYGHSHVLAVDKDARPWVANPGAAAAV